MLGASLPILAALVNKSLLSYGPDRSRYEIHELLRQYLAGQPAEMSTARDRHSAYYCRFLHQREADLRGRRQQEALAEIEAEGENIRLAWQWAVERGQVEQLGPALDGLSLFLLWRGRIYEGEMLCGGTLAALPQPGSTEQGRLRARLLITRSLFLRRLGQFDEAEQVLRQAEGLLDGPPLADLDTRLEQAQLRLGQAAIAQTANISTALALVEQSLTLYQALGEPWGMAQSLELLGETERRAGRLDRAREVHQAGLPQVQTLGDTRGIAQTLQRLGALASHQGRFEEAAALMERSLIIGRQIDDRANWRRPYIAWAPL